ncbi:hypothetical protein I317_00315 [Kwoniella heveanensis CBS 569]|nr:hypothetical protein I317_00315 [Kwoniella heveanensis CBS 569]
MAMSQADQQLIDATNLRSVRRADPNVKSILQTSVYSVVYHYDEVSGKWEKQKQEGPLFVVQRDKSPEWSLYMLNRQAVKNPAIALVPGEMKMTVIDQTMLQVARRGEKQRIGIWFSEGPEVVEKFRTTILGICGEPSKRRDTTPATGHDHVSSPAVVAPQPVAAAEDGLSRLFAGLMKSPPVQSPTVQPKAPTPHRDTTPIQHPPSQPIFSPGPPVPAAPSPIPPPQPPVASPPAQLPSQVSPPPLPPMSSISSPPGQTADDLLMSILGLAPPTTPQPPVNQSQQYHQQNLPTHPHAQQYGLPQLQQMPSQAFSHAPMYPPQSQMNQIAQVPPQSQNQPVPPLQYRSKVGDATFAQTAALPLPVPISHTSSPPQPLTARPSPSDNHAAAPPHPSAQNSFQSRQSPETPNGNIRPGTESRGMMADAVAGEVVRKQRDEGLIIAGIGLGAEERKAEFRRRLTDLILTDDRFVDDIWTEYLDRMSRAGQADG